MQLSEVNRARLLLNRLARQLGGGRQRCRSEGNGARLLVNRLARQLGGEDREVEVKRTVPGFFLTEWLDNWRGRQRCRSEGNGARLLVNRMARQLEGTREM
jgi:hypothetical protein